MEEMHVRECRRLADNRGRMGSMIQKGRKEYVEMKRCPRNESFADGSVGARVRLMVRGDVNR